MFKPFNRLSSNNNKSDDSKEKSYIRGHFTITGGFTIKEEVLKNIIAWIVGGSMLAGGIALGNSHKTIPSETEVENNPNPTKLVDQSPK